MEEKEKHLQEMSMYVKSDVVSCDKNMEIFPVIRTIFLFAR